MANHALRAPQLSGPKLLSKDGVATNTRTRDSLLIPGKNSKWGDDTFHAAMLACGVSVLLIVALIIYELITKGQLAWHAFGWKFFMSRDWDPVNEQFGA